ncbi:hypothetical protein ACJ5HV_12695 [Staphylococcus aureus]
MSLLDRTKAQREGKKHENPLANEDIKKEKLIMTTQKISGDTHAKLLALKNVFSDSDMTNIQILDMGLDMLVNELEGDAQELYDKYYQINIEEKVDILKRKGLY